MKHRNKYDTFVIYLYANGKEHLLPCGFRDMVPYSTASTWRNGTPDSYLGHEYSSIQNESLDWYELLQGHRKLKTTLRVVARVWIAVSSLLMPILQKMDGGALLGHLQKLSTVMPQRTVLRLAGMSAPSFYHRLHRLRAKCGLSHILLCLKRHPFQLSVGEVATMKALLSDVGLACWPISSIAHRARREGLLYASLSTWYKYAALLGIKRAFPRRGQKTRGLVGSRPNQFLHVDTTFHILPDGVRAAIAFVSDNFSRKILGWGISQKHGAGNVKTALDMAIRTIRQYHPDHVCATLVADGGSENHAVSIGELIASTPHPEITKVVALRDIAFSNSPVEAVNKIMKRYIRHGQPQSFEGLEASVAGYVADYNSVRPHCALKGLTPIEAYSQKLPNMDFADQASKARAERLAQNTKGRCPKC